MTVLRPKIEVHGLSVWYGSTPVLQNIDLPIYANRITCIIGPSGAGKTSLLRAINRMTETIPGCRVQGTMLLGGADIRRMPAGLLRRRVGFLPQHPAVFPMSIFENVAYGPRVHGEASHAHLRERVERAMAAAGLWAEVRHRLDEPAEHLSGGQRERLAVARALAVNPDVIMLDEPGATLDPLSAATLDSLLDTLRRRCTLVIVTHNLQQAARLSDFTAFVQAGRLVEFGATHDLFMRPADVRTQEYIVDRFD